MGVWVKTSSLCAVAFGNNVITGFVICSCFFFFFFFFSGGCLPKDKDVCCWGF